MKIIYSRVLWLSIGILSMFLIAFFRSFRDTNILTGLTILCAFLLGILVYKKGRNNLFLFFLPFFIEYSYLFYQLNFSDSSAITYRLYEIFILLLPFFLGYFLNRLTTLLKIGFAFFLTTTVSWYLFAYLPKENYKKFSNYIKNPVHYSYDTIKLLDKDSNSIYLLNKHQSIITLLDVSFIGCKPCKDKFDPLTKLSEKIKSRNDIRVVRIIDGRIDNFKTYQKYYYGKEKKHPNFPIYYDPNGSLAKMLRVEGYPSEYIFNKKQLLFFTLFGFSTSINNNYYTSNTIQKLNVLR